jgi:hypothetical protein
MKYFSTDYPAMLGPIVRSLVALNRFSTKGRSPRRPGTRHSCTPVLRCLRHGAELLTATVEHVLPPFSEYTCLETVVVCSCNTNLNRMIVVHSEMNVIAILDVRGIAIVTPCNVVSGRQRFRRIWCLNFQGEEGT